MKIRIIAGGIYGADGEIPISSEHLVSSVPPGWASRVKVLEDDLADAVAITNTPTRETIAAMDKAELLEWLEAHGWDGDKRLGVEKLRDALTAAMFVGD